MTALIAVVREALRNLKANRVRFVATSCCLVLVLAMFAFMSGRARVVQLSSGRRALAEGSRVVVVSDASGRIPTVDCLALRAPDVRVLALRSTDGARLEKSGSRVFGMYEYMGDLSVLDPSMLERPDQSGSYIGSALSHELGLLSGDELSTVGPDRSHVALRRVASFSPGRRVELFERRLFLPATFGDSELCYLEASGSLSIDQLLGLVSDIFDGPQLIVRALSQSVESTQGGLDSETAIVNFGGVCCFALCFLLVILDRRESGLYRAWGYSRHEVVALRGLTSLAVIVAAGVISASAIGLCGTALPGAFRSAFVHSALRGIYLMMSVCFAGVMVTYTLISRRNVLRLLRE